MSKLLTQVALASLACYFSVGLLIADGPVTVDGQCNIYGAGRAVPPDPRGGGGGVLPVRIDLNLPTRFENYVEFPSVTGLVSCYVAGNKWNCADGGPHNDGETAISAHRGISGITHRKRSMFLVGVFLTDAPPEPNEPNVPGGFECDPNCYVPVDANDPGRTAPPGYEFTVADDFSVLYPAIGQVFLIGDGKTGTCGGDLQRFYVPVGATRLYLGFADSWYFGNRCLNTYEGPGYYGDDGGELEVEYTVKSDTCDGDVNGDGVVDLTDLGIVLNNYGNCNE